MPFFLTGPASTQSSKIIPNSTSPIAINHLFVGKQLAEKNREAGYARARDIIRSRSIDGSVKAFTPSVSDPLSTRLDLYAASQGSGHTMK